MIHTKKGYTTPSGDISLSFLFVVQTNNIKSKAKNLTLFLSKKILKAIPHRGRAVLPIRSLCFHPILIFLCKSYPIPVIARGNEIRFVFVRFHQTA